MNRDTDPQQFVLLTPLKVSECVKKWLQNK